jgi:protoporphyrinogen oxidase
MRNKYFDYPLKPINAMFGLGIPTSYKILSDFIQESAAQALRRKEIRSLEDWVVSKFGRTMFEIYFKEYSEKVWGIDCSDICATWVAQRIHGLSLMKALKNGLFKFSGRNLATLTSDFLYPALGIGRISDRLKDEIEKRNTVFTGTRIEQINHDGARIKSIAVDSQGRKLLHRADDFISSIPITQVLQMLSPAPPARILETAAQLKFRDLVIVAVMADRFRITDQTWIYIPEKKIPFGRIHEPTNWSRAMAPPGKSLLVAEFFSFRNDEAWLSAFRMRIRSLRSATANSRMNCMTTWPASAICISRAGAACSNITIWIWRSGPAWRLRRRSCENQSSLLFPNLPSSLSPDVMVYEMRACHTRMGP